VGLFRSILQLLQDIIQEDAITVQLKKKRNLPLILNAMQTFSGQNYPWLNGKNVIFEGATCS